MTPEERWIKIENAVEALVGSQAQQGGQIAEIGKQTAILGQLMERKFSQIDAQIEKNTAAIKDLIVISRTIIDSQRTTEKQMAQLHSDIKAELELLIKAVNAFLKGFQKPNGNQ